LHEHVIQRGGNGPGADCIRVAGVPGDLDRVCGWVGQEHSHDTPSLPFIDLGDIDGIDINHEWESPDLAESRGERELTPNLGDVGQGEHGEHVEDGGGDDEEVGFEGAEAETFQCKGEVLRGGCFGDLEKEPDYVERPEVVVRHGFPEEFGGYRLAVVHPALGGVFADHTVDHDDFLAVGEPSVLASEPTLCLGRAGWHKDERGQAKNQCQ